MHEYDLAFVRAYAFGSRRTKQLETVATRVIAASGSFNSARGIGSQASVGASFFVKQNTL